MFFSIFLSIIPIALSPLGTFKSELEEPEPVDDRPAGDVHAQTDTDMAFQERLPQDDLGDSL